MFALVDCNNFYISCERIFSPTLKNRPAVVLSNNDGCIVARSNEAKALGIKMGVPAFKIENVLRDNNVAVFSSNYALYGDISDRVMSILTEHAPNIEIYSIDEAFLDVANIPLDRLVIFARGLQTKIKRWTGIPVSIGIAPTKTLAKVANKLSKKNSKLEGLFIISEEKKLKKLFQHFPLKIFGELVGNIPVRFVHTELLQGSNSGICKMNGFVKFILLSVCVSLKNYAELLA